MNKGKQIGLQSHKFAQYNQCQHSQVEHNTNKCEAERVAALIKAGCDRRCKYQSTATLTSTETQKLMARAASPSRRPFLSDECVVWTLLFKAGCDTSSLHVTSTLKSSVYRPMTLSEKGMAAA